MEDIVILIPAYKPEKEIMAKFLDGLTKKFKNIDIVNDGSGAEFDDFFVSLKKQGLDVVYHEVNKGKGRAIKTGFDYILNKYSNALGTITADCDGQHTVEDIIKCAEELRKHREDLIVGCRDFNQDDVPARSKFGNKLTRTIFKIFIGINITDTQSGLRAFGKNLMNLFLKTEGERYEYETNMLIECKTYDIKIQEVTIKTVYINKNEGSHFNPIKDSIKIYKLFFKYIISAVSSFLLDILLFTLFVNIIKIDQKIIVATVLARIISAVYNFVINSKLVFKKGSKSSIIKYIILSIIQMLVSGYAVTYIAKFININATVIKIVVDTIIFLVNFVIQREWVFKNK